QKNGPDQRCHRWSGPGPLPVKGRLRTYVQGYSPTYARDASCVPCASLCAARPGGGAAVSVAFTSFPGLPASVAAARRFVAASLRACPEVTVSDEVIDTVELITSELATNTIRHTCSGDPGQTFTVRVETDRRGVWGEVRSGRPRL